MGLNDYLLLLLGFQKVGLLKREEKNSLLMHAPISAMFSLFFLPLSFSFLFSFSPLFPSFSIISFFLSFSVFPCLAIGRSPFSSMATSPFYSKLIPCDFSLLPLRLHLLFLACCGHSFRTIHQLIGYPATTIAQYILTLALLIS